MLKRCEILNKFYDFFMKIPNTRNAISKRIGGDVYIKGKETIIKVNKDGSKYVKTEIIKL